MDKILTVNDVADVLQVKAITVREMFREKRLRGFKVGKSWRTTETMLREDIDALARGESPATLPAPGIPAPGPTEPSAPAAAPEAPAAAARPVSVPPAAASRPATPPKPAAPPARESEVPAPPARKSPAPAREKADDGDDTQQLLF